MTIQRNSLLQPTLNVFDGREIEEWQENIDRIMQERLNRLQHERLGLLEDEIRAGCTSCHGPMLINGVPNGIIVYRQGIAPDIGKPYCFKCAQQNGWCCEPGDDYAI